MIYRPRRDSGTRGGRKSFAWTDYRDLLADAHQQLPGGTIVLIWDNLGTHTCGDMQEYASGRDWLRIYQLPSYAPDLNPVETLWSLVRRPLANTVFTDPDHLIATIRTGLRRIQHRPGLIDSCLAATGLNPANQP